MQHSAERVARSEHPPAEEAARRIVDGTSTFSENEARTVATAYLSERTRREKMEEALREIRGGFVPNGATLVLNDNWRAFSEALQGIARKALEKDK